MQRDPKGGLLALITGSGTTGEYYYVLDGQSSVIGLVDAAGTERARYTYDPHGAHDTATAVNGTLPDNPYRYASGRAIALNASNGRLGPRSGGHRLGGVGALAGHRVDADVHPDSEGAAGERLNLTALLAARRRCGAGHGATVEPDGSTRSSISTGVHRRHQRLCRTNLQLRGVKTACPRQDSNLRHPL